MSRTEGTKEGGRVGEHGKDKCTNLDFFPSRNFFPSRILNQICFQNLVSAWIWDPGKYLKKRQHSKPYMGLGLSDF